MSELKPCPFCGNEKLFIKKSSGWATSCQPYSVRCHKCGCEGPAPNNYTKAHAEKSWNTRHLPEEKSCKNCAEYAKEYESDCFDWPKCSITFDKWQPKPPQEGE